MSYPSAPPPPHGSWAPGDPQPPPGEPPPAWTYQGGPAAVAAGSLAEWWKRLLAILLDGVILAIPIAVLNVVLIVSAVDTDSVAGDDTVNGGPILAVYTLGLIAGLLYFALLDGGPSGATVGKRVLKIQVRDATTGGPLGVGKAFARRLLYQVLFWLLVVPGILNVLWPLWDARRQAWHDKAVGSLVVNA